MVWSVFNYFLTQTLVAKEGESYSSLLAEQKVAENAKSC